MHALSGEHGVPEILRSSRTILGMAKHLFWGDHRPDPAEQTLMTTKVKQKKTVTESMLLTKRQNVEETDTPLERLIAELGSRDDIVRVRARRSLVAKGKTAVPLLIRALEDENNTMRWEAAKTLSEIEDPEAAPALVKALEDEMFEVRWVAAEGLAKMNMKGLKPLLHALTEHGDSVLLREGAHHVFHDLTKGALKKYLTPVLAALEAIEHEGGIPWVPTHSQRLEVPQAALQALEMLEKEKKPSDT
jgi:HEAT repeat protein